MQPNPAHLSKASEVISKASKSLVWLLVSMFYHSIGWIFLTRMRFSCRDLWSIPTGQQQRGQLSVPWSPVHIQRTPHFAVLRISLMWSILAQSLRRWITMMKQCFHMESFYWLRHPVCMECSWCLWKDLRWSCTCFHYDSQYCLNIGIPNPQLPGYLLSQR